MASEAAKVKRPLPAVFASVALMLISALIALISSHSKHEIHPPPASPAHASTADNKLTAQAMKPGQA